MPHRLLSIILLTCSFLTGNLLFGQNKVVIRLDQTKQETKYGVNIVTEISKEIYRLSRYDSLIGSTDIGQKPTLGLKSIREIEKFYKTRIDSITMLEFFEEWAFEGDQIKIITGGISLMQKDSIGNLTRIAFYKYKNLENGFKQHILPVNLLGDAPVTLDQWIKERRFNFDLIFFEGRTFNEKKGKEQLAKFSKQFKIPQPPDFGNKSRIIEMVLLPKSQSDSMGKVVSTDLIEYFKTHPEEYFNLTNGSRGFKFYKDGFKPDISFMVYRFTIEKSKNTTSIAFYNPLDIIIYSKNSPLPDTISAADMELIPVKFGQGTTLKNELMNVVFSDAWRLIKINQTPIPAEASAWMLESLRYPNNWPKLDEILKMIEADNK